MELFDKQIPFVSVCMITFNHEKFIAQAIESVLMQKTSFSIELVIGEDCSTDNTRAICLEYKKKYPEKIKLLIRDKNLGVMPNFIETLHACTGKYIALCEGDDYWTDPYKLQKQVDVLEKNPDIILCHHGFDILNHDGRVHLNRNEFNKRKKIRSIFDLLLEGSFPVTLSAVFRNCDILLNLNYPPFREVKTGDVLLWHLLLIKGNAFYIDEIMGVYRSHSGGITNILNYQDSIRSKIIIIEFLLKHRLLSDVSLLKSILAKNYLQLFNYTYDLRYFNRFFLNAIFSKYTFFKPSYEIKNRVKILHLLLVVFKLPFVLKYNRL